MAKRQTEYTVIRLQSDRGDVSLVSGPIDPQVARLLTDWVGAQCPDSLATTWWPPYRVGGPQVAEFRTERALVQSVIEWAASSSPDYSALPRSVICRAGADWLADLATDWEFAE